MSGRLDGIVNRAGSLLLTPAHHTTAQELQDALTANLVSAFATVRPAPARCGRQADPSC